MPDRDDLLFAEHAVKSGLVSQEVVDETLGVQRRMEEMGVEESLRNVLVKRGALSEGDALVVARRAGLASGREPIPGYVLEKRLGTGAMGSVYLALQKSMRRHVAVKILRRDLTDDPRQVERLQREAKLVGQLDHPNIVRGLDSGQSGGLVWFVMEYVEGETLQERIRREGRLELDEALALTRQLAEAMAHAHEHGIVHRDVKPGNVLLTRAGLPRLTDYGLAKGETDDALTHVDATLGTPQYISPEQARNPRDADIRSDVYSLGATLYAMLTGHPPYSGDTLAEILTKVLYDRPAPLEEEVPELSRPVVYLVQRMMAKDRAHRYATPEAVLADVRALEAGKLHVPLGFRGDLVEFEERRRRRRRVTRAVLAIGGAVGVALAAALYDNHLTAQEREADSRRSFESTVAMAGDPDEWDAGTVDRMLGEWDDFVRRYPQSSRFEDAQRERDRWHAQSSAIRRVQELALRTGQLRDQGVAADWSSLLDEYDRLAARLADDPDVAVARERLARERRGAAAARDVYAQRLLSEATDRAAELDLVGAAETLEGAAAALRERFHPQGEAAVVRTADETAAAFRSVHERVSAALAELDAFAAAPGPRNYLAERARLDAAAERLGNDGELAGLPPRGARVEAVRERLDRRRRALETACETEWVQVRDTARTAAESLEFDAALETLSEFSLRACPAEGTAAAELVAEIRAGRDRGETRLADRVRELRDEFFAALSDSDVPAARRALQVLSEESAEWPAGYRPEPALLAGAGELVDAIEELAWEPLRRKLRAGVRPDGPVEFDNFRYPVVEVVRLETDGRVRVQVRADAEPTFHALESIGFQTLVELAGLDLRAEDDGRSALAYVGLRLTHYRPDPGARNPLRQVDPLGPVLTRLRENERLHRIAAELTRLRDDLVQEVESRELAAERDARELHAKARDAFDRRAYLDSVAHITRLLVEKEFYRTKYVRDRREHLEREREAAERAHDVRGFERSFPGTTISSLPAGRSRIWFDFDSPEQADAWSLAPGHTELRFRDRLVAALPAAVHPGVAGPLARNGYLAWKRWDGTAETHPRHFPLTLRFPFVARHRIEVEFLYRSHAPYFLLVSVGGVNAGILSAPDDREGGQGVVLWQGDELEEPDRVFAERHRADWVERHPETAERQADGRYFRFQPSRWYRVRLVKDAYRAEFFVDGLSVASEPIRALSGRWADRIVVVSYTSGEIDDLVLSGVLDPDWLAEDE